MVCQTNEYAIDYQPSKEDAPLSCVQRPINRRELYAYFGVVIYIGVVVQPLIKAYQATKAGIANWPSNYISRIHFQQLNRYICASSIPDNSFHITFNRVDKLSEHIRVRYWQYQVLGTHLAVNKTIERFIGRASKIVNIPIKPTPKGFKIWVLAN